MPHHTTGVDPTHCAVDTRPPENFVRERFGPTINFSRGRFTSRITTFNRAEFPIGVEPFMKARFSEPLLVDDALRWTKLLRGAHVLGPLNANGSAVEKDTPEAEST